MESQSGQPTSLRVHLPLRVTTRGMGNKQGQLAREKSGDPLAQIEQ